MIHQFFRNGFVALFAILTLSFAVHAQSSNTDFSHVKMALLHK